jgi:hypothetical protein
MLRVARLGLPRHAGVQVNFTEDGPGRFDIKFWLDIMRRIKRHGAWLKAGGIVAFNPTKVPQPLLGSSDPFGDMTKACKDRTWVVACSRGQSQCAAR